MSMKVPAPSVQVLRQLLKLDHTLNGAVLYGLDGQRIELQARAVEVLKRPQPWRACARITGMPRGAVNEALDRISGAFTKLEYPEPQVEILINLLPADFPKDGTSLDLP